MKAFDTDAYATAAAAAIDLTLPDHCRPAVIANLARLAEIAKSLDDFPLDGANQRDPRGQ